jgi:hypothetical protein
MTDDYDEIPIEDTDEYWAYEHSTFIDREPHYNTKEQSYV